MLEATTKREGGDGEREPATAGHRFAGAGQVPDSAPSISFERVSKVFLSKAQRVEVVKDLFLDIRGGEFFSLLGPSGCGKTTTLRMIAGFEHPTAGEIYLNGQSVVGVPPHRRDTNMVFQSYALFPHMTVFENIVYGLRRHRIPKPEQIRRVKEAIELVELGTQVNRKPAHLSGGQQQRVALARALVNRPQVLLLDEPLGALDFKLRQAMQIELKRIQREAGITFIYVTHDQSEAFAMSDRIAVLNGGRLEQVGAPADLYERPATKFVATFVGQSNFLPLPTPTGNEVNVAISYRERIALPERALQPSLEGGVGTRTMLVRPERLRVEREDGETFEDGAQADSVLYGTTEDVSYEGSRTVAQIRHGRFGRLTASLDARLAHGVELAPGCDVRLSWRREDGFILPADDADEANPSE